MNYKIVNTILRKELLETLRDRRTLIAMIGIPIILYPAIFIVMSQFTIIQQTKLQSQQSSVAFIGDDTDSITAWIESTSKQSDTETEIDEHQQKLIKTIGNINFLEISDEVREQINNSIASDDGKLEEILHKNSIDAIAVISSSEQSSLEEHDARTFTNIEVKISYDNTVPTSSQARKRLIKLFQGYSDYAREKRLSELEVTAELISPVKIIIRDVAPPEKTAGSILGRILPMLMIMSLAVAAFYPALDLTAGEKERGTFETLLSTPVRKTEIVTGKFLAIFILAMITATLSLASMAMTIAGQLGQMASAISDANSPFTALHISPLTIVIMLLILMPMAFFICSVMMSIALFARNFREAQHYVTPFYLGITLPAVAASMPTVELTNFTMLIPIVNVALLFKELLIGNFAVNMITGVFISISGWALLALTISVRLFQSEQLILSQEKGLAVTIKRSLIQPSDKPNAGMGLGMFAFCLLGLFYVGSYFQSKNMISGIIITEWIIVLAPVLASLWFYKIDMVKSLSLKMPRWYEPILSVVLILASNIIIMRLGIEMSKYMPMPEALSKLAEAMMGDDHSWPTTLKLIFAIAISAAVCEEALFRGMVLSGLKKKTGTNHLPAVIITAMLFAIMHMSIYRLMPTFILGIVLGYLTWRTGSIFNSMLAHCVNNAVPVLLLNEKLPILQKWLSQFEGESAEAINPMPVWVILTAMAVIVGVVLLMEQLNNNRTSKQNIELAKGE